MGIAKDGKYGLTLDRVREVLSYDPETGIFRWRIKLSDRAPIGKVAGGRAPKGQWRIKIDGRYYMAHRLAWFLMTGVWPSEVDHKNRIGRDNRWENLRECTHSQNHANTKCRSDNTSGFKGVQFRKQTGKYQATVVKDGKRVHVGSFARAEDAFEAYCRKAVEMFGEFHHSGVG